MDPQQARAKEIEEYVQKYTAALPVQRARPIVTDKTITVLLTGSTGNIGSHILASLLQEPRITKVYTLNRPSPTSSPRERLATAFKDRSLPVDLLSLPKLTASTGDLTQPDWGLTPDLYEEVWAYFSSSFV